MDKVSKSCNEQGCYGDGFNQGYDEGLLRALELVGENEMELDGEELKIAHELGVSNEANSYTIGRNQLRAELRAKLRKETKDE